MDKACMNIPQPDLQYPLYRTRNIQQNVIKENLRNLLKNSLDHNSQSPALYFLLPNTPTNLHLPSPDDSIRINVSSQMLLY